MGSYAKLSTSDIGIRRFRIQMYSQLTDRVFIYSQFGINNLTYDSDRASGGTPGASQSGTGGFFLRDAVGEYAVIKNKLSLGVWNGLARYASPSTGTIMGLDLPLVEENYQRCERPVRTQDQRVCQG